MHVARVVHLLGSTILNHIAVCRVIMTNTVGLPFNGESNR